eukprot:2367518-Pleurochrysis_carterae.AAC.1
MFQDLAQRKGRKKSTERSRQRRCQTREAGENSSRTWQASASESGDECETERPERGRDAGWKRA